MPVRTKPVPGRLPVDPGLQAPPARFTVIGAGGR